MTICSWFAFLVFRCVTKSVSAPHCSHVREWRSGKVGGNTFTAYRRAGLPLQSLLVNQKTLLHLHLHLEAAMNATITPVWGPTLEMQIRLHKGPTQCIRQLRYAHLRDTRTSAAPVDSSHPLSGTIAHAHEHSIRSTNSLSFFASLTLSLEATVTFRFGFSVGFCFQFLVFSLTLTGAHRTGNQSENPRKWAFLQLTVFCLNIWEKGAVEIPSSVCAAMRF